MAEVDRELQIGRVLKEARARAGFDIRTVEERTKIRVKYLRALEDEQWDVLPSPAYAKGFLRTYAQTLGLDGEALVDEFRRRVEVAEGEPSYPLAEQVLERGRRPGEAPRRPPSARVLLIAGGVAVAAILLVLGITGGDDDADPGRRAAKQDAREQRRDERAAERLRERRQRAAEQVELELAVNADVSVCLLGEGGEELIDGQVLSAGTEERFSAKRFELRFPVGYDRGFFELRLGGERVRVPETQGPTAFSITPPAKLRPAPDPGPECP